MLRATHFQYLLIYPISRVNTRRGSRRVFPKSRLKKSLCAFTDFFLYYFSCFLILCADRDIHLQLRFCPWRAHHDRTMIFQLIKFLDIIYESTLIVYRNYIEEMNGIKRRILAQSWLFKAKKQWRYHCFLYSLGLMPSTLWNALLK